MSKPTKNIETFNKNEKCGNSLELIVGMVGNDCERDTLFNGVTKIRNAHLSNNRVANGRCGDICYVDLYACSLRASR